MQHQNKQLPSESGLSKIKNFITNSLFHIQGYFSKKEQRNILTILGKSYQFQQGMHQFKKIIWFTYRKNFPCLLKTDCNSDAGWGCMIRVGQMLLAQSLKRHMKITSQQDFLSVISAFMDDDQDKKDCINYSIQKIVKIYEKTFKVSPGQWLTVPNISFVLEEIHNNFPLRGYEKMKIKVLNNGAIFYGSILNALGYETCSCKQNSLYCSQKCHKQKTKLSIMIIVIVRLGVGKVLPHFYSMIRDLFLIKYFNGMIGGKPNKALYFVGTINQQLIYLDPHYVQSSTSRKNLTTQLQSYFCDSLRSIPYVQIQPSAGISFYLNSVEDLEDFRNQISKLEQKYGKQFIIYTSLNPPPAIFSPDSDQYVVSQTSAQILVREESSSIQTPGSFDVDV